MIIPSTSRAVLFGAAFFISAATAALEVPLGIEITLTPTGTIYWRFGPAVAIGSAMTE